MGLWDYSTDGKGHYYKEVLYSGSFEDMPPTDTELVECSAEEYYGQKSVDELKGKIAFAMVKLTLVLGVLYAAMAGVIYLKNTIQDWSTYRTAKQELVCVQEKTDKCIKNASSKSVSLVECIQEDITDRWILSSYITDTTKHIVPYAPWETQDGEHISYSPEGGYKLPDDLSSATTGVIRGYYLTSTGAIDRTSYYSVYEVIMALSEGSRKCEGIFWVYGSKTKSENTYDFDCVEYLEKNGLEPTPNLKFVKAELSKAPTHCRDAKDDGKPTMPYRDFMRKKYPNRIGFLESKLSPPVPTKRENTVDYLLRSSEKIPIFKPPIKKPKFKKAKKIRSDF